MNQLLNFDEKENPTSLQDKLFWIAGSFLFFTSLALSIAPLAQARSLDATLKWQHWIGFAAWLTAFIALRFFLDRYSIKITSSLVPTVSLLSGWGILSIYRLAPSMGFKQSIWLLISVAAFILALPWRAQILKIIRTYKYLWLMAGLLLIVLTIFLGTNPNGSGPRLWLGLGGVFFQPSELLKLLLILFLSAYFADRQPFFTRLIPLLLPTLLVTGVAGLLLIFQRDLGTAAILFFLYAAMIYASLGKKRLPAITLFGFILSAVIGYFLIPIVKLRVDIWINPWADPSGSAYQIIQSLMAIANGGVSGRGPGLGAPYVVPIAFSDFIFSSIAEEFGLPGSIALILCLLLLVYFAIQIGLESASRHQRYMAIGIAAYLGGQSILIIGGNTRAFPLTGVTLPFMSYGGSSLLISFLAIFLLTAISQTESSQTSQTFEDHPVRNLWIAISLAFLGLALVAGWWSVYRGPDLLTRTDNPRRTISDQLTRRGKIIDRNSIPLSFTIGESGNFSRIYSYPEAAHLIGYTNPFYGQTGLEESLDTQLRGLDNQSDSALWSSHLLYGLPPPGQDVRLSLDIRLQQQAQNAIEGHNGAVVLLQAETGEILTLLSSPGYDPNSLEQLWEQIRADSRSPLLNRATQGLYPPGPALAPFLLAATNTLGTIPSPPEVLGVSYTGYRIECTTTISQPYTWEAAAAAGCPAPLRLPGNSLGEDGLSSLFASLGFYHRPEIYVETAPAFIPDGLPIPSASAYGQDEILVSPLQLARAGAALSNHGKVPDLKLVLGLETYLNEWIQPKIEFSQFRRLVKISEDSADQTAMALAHRQLPIWEVTAFAVTDQGNYITWYLAGTLPSDNEGAAANTIVVLLEEANAQLAQTIGRQLISEAISP